MNNLSFTNSRFPLLIGLLIFLLNSPIKAKVGVPVASINELNGSVQMTPQQTGRKLVARSGSFLGEEDILEKGKDGRYKRQEDKNRWKSTGGGRPGNPWVPWNGPDPLVYPTLVVFLEADLPWATALGRSYRVTITPC